MPNFYENAIELAITEKSSEYTEKVKANEMNPLLSVYENLLNLGADSITEKTHKKYIRISRHNFYFASIRSPAQLSICRSQFSGSAWYAWLNAILALTLTCLFVLFMNGFGKTKMSRLTYMLGANSFLLLNALFIGPLSQSETYFIPAIIIPFLIYDPQRTGPHHQPG